MSYPTLAMSEHEQLVDLLRDHHEILIFTGAGISTGSGIPDFRGPQGIWRKRQPVFFDEFLASEAKRIEYWDYKLEGHQQFQHAEPNAAHRAIVELEELGRLRALVTQNIDGLHQDAGSSANKVIEMHGTNRAIECVECQARSDLEEAYAYFRAQRKPPECGCGGWLKPATISFGQSLRPEVLERAATEASRADLAISLGSTLSVNPAASIPLIAVQNGAPYVIINRGDTDHDDMATLRIDADVVEFLPPVIAALAH